MKRRNFLKHNAVAVSGFLGLQSFGSNAIYSSFAGEINTSLKNVLLEVSAKEKGSPLIHYWSRCVGAGRANEGLRANWLEHLSMVHKACGFQYLRFHGLFHDDMFVYREAEGKPVFNWQYIDELFDRMLDMGVRPFVELGFFPKAMSPEPTCFWWGGHGNYPKDISKWKLLIENFVRHCIARYGAEEVRQWYFEVWNEPDLNGFWNGTQLQYFELYKLSALTIKSVDPALRVGGPATSSYHPDEAVFEEMKKIRNISAKDFIGVESKSLWIIDFLKYCEKENLPLDFISSHPYPTTYPIDSTGNGFELSRPVTATYTDLQWLRKTIAASKYSHVEVHLTEWSSSPSPRDYTHDYLQVAAYIIKVNLDCIGMANSLSYWTFTDVFEEGGAGDSVFHGGFGMINFQGIVKPSFHGYRMLHQLGNELLKKEDGVIVSRHSHNKKIVALLYHYPEEVIAAVPVSKGTRDIAEQTLQSGSHRKYAVDITDLKPGAALGIEILDEQNGFAFRDWQKMGSPEPPTREQVKTLREKSLSTKKMTVKADAKGRLQWSSDLNPWTVVLLKEV